MPTHVSHTIGRADESPVPTLRITDVYKSFPSPHGEIKAVKGLSVSIEAGEIVAILGSNGAGKTTAIDMVMGLSRPDSGTITVLGMTPRQAISAGRVSSVMQTGGLLGEITAREIVELIASFYPQHRAIDECMERSGAKEFANRKVEKCSGGQKQRIRFALALLPNPSLLILDEPTTGMDVAARRDFWNAISEDKASGRTVLFATHYLEEADKYADRIVLVADGTVFADGTPTEIKAMVSGYRVSLTLEGANRAWLSSLPGVTSVEWQGSRFHLVTTDADSLARTVLNDTDARDLEITARSLDEAFLAITTQEGKK